MTEGLAGDLGDLPIERLPRLGYGFVVAEDPTRALVDEIVGAGLQLGFLSGEIATAGFQAGVEAAQAAAEMALSAGFPLTRPIFFCAYQVAPAVTEWFRGAALVLGPARIGVRGPRTAVEAILGSGAARYAWQTPGGLWDPRAGLQTYALQMPTQGVVVDLCRAVSEDWGGWSG